MENDESSSLKFMCTKKEYVYHLMEIYYNICIFDRASSQWMEGEDL